MSGIYTFRFVFLVAVQRHSSRSKPYSTISQLNVRDTQEVEFCDQVYMELMQRYYSTSLEACTFTYLYQSKSEFREYGISRLTGNRLRINMSDKPVSQAIVHLFTLLELSRGSNHTVLLISPSGTSTDFLHRDPRPHMCTSRDRLSAESFCIIDSSHLHKLRIDTLGVPQISENYIGRFRVRGLDITSG
jgi:hypothetical protein